MSPKFYNNCQIELKFSETVLVSELILWYWYLKSDTLYFCYSSKGENFWKFWQFSSQINSLKMTSEQKSNVIIGRANFHVDFKFIWFYSSYLKKNAKPASYFDGIETQNSFVWSILQSFLFPWNYDAYNQWCL